MYMNVAVEVFQTISAVKNRSHLCISAPLIAFIINFSPFSNISICRHGCGEDLLALKFHLNKTFLEEADSDSRERVWTGFLVRLRRFNFKASLSQFDDRQVTI